MNSYLFIRNSGAVGREDNGLTKPDKTATFSVSYAGAREDYELVGYKVRREIARVEASRTLSKPLVYP